MSDKVMTAEEALAILADRWDITNFRTGDMVKAFAPPERWTTLVTAAARVEALEAAVCDLYALVSEMGGVPDNKYHIVTRAAALITTPAPALAEDVCPKCGNSGWLPRKDPSNPRSDNVRCQECADKPTPAAGAPETGGDSDV